jgi:hypothetical protein
MKQLTLIISILMAYTSVAQPQWQQRVDTKIEVRLDDRQNFLHAFEEFTYYNNSPDTLKFIYVHLWPNAYKNDHTPFAKQLDLNGNTSFYFAKDKDRGYIDSLQFTINGQSVDYNSTYDAPDIARLDLLKPLLPGQNIKIATPFRVKIPIVFSRMGHTGQSYYISQWFPKPAVYDQKGWHPLSYLDQGEFFSEYGSYDVSITLPSNYVLMATGNCLDEKENQWLDDLSKQPHGHDTDYSNAIPASDIEMKTVRYHEDNIHDFAWFADKRWIVRKDTVYSPGNNQLVTTWTAFAPAYLEVWKNANNYLKETIKHYGKWVGPYPYKTIKAVLGDMHAGGGMEYPTVTIIDKSANSNLRSTIVHEAGHNWFYGMLGSNERDHAWMDEGINTFYEQKTTLDLNHDTSAKAKITLDENLLYYENAATHNDQAIEQTSANFTKLDYGLDVYYKTTLMLRWLEKYVGKDDFERGMQDYYNAWRYHHPYPGDFRVCMQRNTPKSLNWFFDTILKTDQKIDFAIINARASGNNTEVAIRNNTGVYAPVLIDAYDDNDSLVASTWTTPFVQDTTLSLPVSAWKTLKIDQHIPDGKMANNVYRRSALSHHFGLEARGLLGYNVAEKDKIFISPALGDNQYDGFMLGILLHNLTVPENRFRFAVAPMYAFGSNSIVGTGSVGYIWYPGNLFKEILLQADAKTFHDNETLVNLNAPLYAGYTKVAPSLNITFNEHDPLSPVARTLTLKEYNITEQNIYFADSIARPSLKPQANIYGLIRYRHRNDRTYNPFNYTIEGQMGADFAKLTAEGNIRIDYNVKNKSLYIRGFLGEFIPLNSDPAVYSRYELNSSYTGVDDYLYDGTYRGRNDANGIGAQQVSIQEGGFKIPVFNQVDRSDSWMAAINLETDLPLKKLPIRIFFDAGLIPNENPSITNSGSSTLLYDGGVEAVLIKDVVSVYVPIIMSSDFQNYLVNTYGKSHLYTRSISFTFQMQNIDWLKAPGKLLKSAVN